MAKATSRSVGLRSREQLWLEHLRSARQQAQTLQAYAQAEGLSVSALYTARSTLNRRGVVTEPSASAPTFVPVHIPPSGTAFRVHLPNGVVVEVASHGRARESTYAGAYSPLCQVRRP